ncbi:hypothetical protein PM082_010177 [Marasmius tenuissimus]|nr:hypothetical protein PM082_010177 [Marasmius tenuissimus]
MTSKFGARPDDFLVLLANAVTRHDVKDQLVGDPSGYTNARRLDGFQPLRLHDTSIVFSRVIVIVPKLLAGEKARASSGGCDFVTITSTSMLSSQRHLRDSGIRHYQALAIGYSSRRASTRASERTNGSTDGPSSRGSVHISSESIRPFLEETLSFGLMRVGFRTGV